jgi:hypothetical protein
MSGGSAPTPPSPTASAQAEASAQLAGQMFQAQNAPILGYEDALTRGMFQPYETSLISGLSAQSAAQQASANQAIQSSTNPLAYQAHQMGMAGANARMGSLYGVNPSGYSYSDPNAFALPSLGMLPSLANVSSASRAIGSNLGSVNIGPGGNVQLMQPQNPQPLYITGH